VPLCYAFYKIAKKSAKTIENHFSIKKPLKEKLFSFTLARKSKANNYKNTKENNFSFIKLMRIV
jgi:predicted transposase YbfD/YdcC